MRNTRTKVVRLPEDVHQELVRRSGVEDRPIGSVLRKLLGLSKPNGAGPAHPAEELTQAIESTESVEVTLPVSKPVTVRGPGGQVARSRGADWSGPAVVSSVCKCGHGPAAHVDGTGRCQWGNGCPLGCRGYRPAEGEA